MDRLLRVREGVAVLGLFLAIIVFSGLVALWGLFFSSVSNGFHPRWNDRNPIARIAASLSVLAWFLSIPVAMGYFEGPTPGRPLLYGFILWISSLVFLAAYFIANYLATRVASSRR